MTPEGEAWSIPGRLDRSVLVLKGFLDGEQSLFCRSPLGSTMESS